jgi:hypothetical protein
MKTTCRPERARLFPELALNWALFINAFISVIYLKSSLRLSALFSAAAFALRLLTNVKCQARLGITLHALILSPCNDKPQNCRFAFFSAVRQNS